MALSIYISIPWFSEDLKPLQRSCLSVRFVYVLIIVNIEIQNCSKICGDSDWGSLSHKSILSLSHSLGTMMEEDAERVFGPEVDKVQSKPCLLIMTGSTTLRNSQQPWVPAQAWAGQHSSVDPGRCSQSLHKSSFTFSPSLPSHTWVQRICSSFSKDWIFHVTQSFSTELPQFPSAFLVCRNFEWHIFSLWALFLHLSHISWQLLMPHTICLTLWTGRFLILCYYFSGYPRRRNIW